MVDAPPAERTEAWGDPWAGATSFGPATGVGRARRVAGQPAGPPRLVHQRRSAATTGSRRRPRSATGSPEPTGDSDRDLKALIVCAAGRATAAAVDLLAPPLVSEWSGDSNRRRVAGPRPGRPAEPGPQLDQARQRHPHRRPAHAAARPSVTHPALASHGRRPVRRPRRRQTRGQEARRDHLRARHAAGRPGRHRRRRRVAASALGQDDPALDSIGGINAAGPPGDLV